MKKFILPGYIVIMLLVSCGQNNEISSTPPVKRVPPKLSPRKNFAVADFVQKWEKATPESQGIDSKYLVQMMEELHASNRNIDEIVIIRNGYLVFDAFRKPYTPDIPHVLFSCTKSVISTLIGMAIADGYIEGPEQPVIDLLPSKSHKLKGVLSPEIKLKHLLTMTSGLEDRGAAEFSQWMKSDDMVSYVLNKKQVYNPGETYNYSTQTAYVLGAILRENIGRNVDVYAAEKLFKPLGINKYIWAISQEEIVRGGGAFGGLRLTAKDFARFAVMIEQEGKWKGEQIVPAEWVKTATSPHTSLDQTKDQNPGYAYGYLWWISEDNKTIVIKGTAGQRALIVPDENLVVIFVSTLFRNLYRDYPEEIYFKYIQKSISHQDIPANSEANNKLETLAASWEEKIESAETIPEELIPFLNTRYELEKNRFDLLAVEIKYQDGKLSYMEESTNVKRISHAGIGKYITIQDGDDSIANAAIFSDPDKFRIHRIGLGNSWGDMTAEFKDNTIKISVSVAGGNSTLLRGQSAGKATF